MNATLYAFLAASGPCGVSRPAVRQWACQHGQDPRGALRAVDRAAARGQLLARPGPPMARVAVTVVYIVPVPPC